MLENLRDISIILLAIESLIIGVILAILLVQIRNVVIMLRAEIKPVLDSTQETTQTLAATTQFVSKRVTGPAVDAAAFVAGVRQSAKTLQRRVAPGRSGSTAIMPSESAPSAPPPIAPSEPPQIG